MLRFVNIHTHKDCASDDAICLRSHRLGIGEQEPPTPFSAGIHPWDAVILSDFTKSYEYLTTQDIAAIGEIGLDYARSLDKEMQMEVFSRQLSIAETRELPVILHCVRAFEDMFAELKHHSLRGVIFHGYIGSSEMTRRIIDAGYYLSFGATSFASSKTAKTLKQIPPEQLFFETDDSDCITTEEIYSRASDLLDIQPELLKAKIYDNYMKLFDRQ